MYCVFPTQLFSLEPELWFFGEDQKCSWGSKMKNKPNFFFDNRGFPNWGLEGRGGPPLENFSHIIPFFFWRRPSSNLGEVIDQLVFQSPIGQRLGFQWIQSWRCFVRCLRAELATTRYECQAPPLNRIEQSTAVGKDIWPCYLLRTKLFL